MKNLATALAGLLLLACIQVEEAVAQDVGDYQSAATGDWSASGTWATFDGADWVAAMAPPTGAETITVTDVHTVTVDVPVVISGYVKVEAEGEIAVEGGSLTFTDGSTYEHARNGGSMPLSTWEAGSYAHLTGIVTDAPANRGQDYHHLVLNTPDQLSNRDLSLDGNTIGGNIHQVTSGLARWQLVGGDSGTVTIMGDLIVEAGQFAAQGTGSATEVIIDHHGDVIVTGGNFSISRGSQAGGTGSTTWNLHGGNFSLSNATTQNSNPVAGRAKVVFAGSGTQQLSFDNVTYAGGGFHFDVEATSELDVAGGFVANGLVVNRGAITALGDLTFGATGVYDHARNGGSVPSAIWSEGSTAMLTGVASDAPGNRGQDYHHLVLNTPDLTANRDLSLDGNTIGGNVHVVSTGTARWQLVGGSSGTVTIMGDVIVEAGQFTAHGTGSITHLVIDHYGDVVVTGGNFSVARGSQGGEGTTLWNLHEGDFSMSNATTQNSNRPGATFVFSGEGEQQISLSNMTYAGGGLPITVAEDAVLVVTADPIGGNGEFTVQDGGALATAHPTGIDGAVQTTGIITFEPQAGLWFVGTEAQVFGSFMPDAVGVLLIGNPAGVTATGTTSVGTLVVEAGAQLLIDETGALSAGSGTVDGLIVNEGELTATEALDFGSEATYDHARNGGSVPSGNWAEGSTAMLTGIASDAPGNRGQDYHHLVLNTPDLSANRDLSLDGNTISGDIHVISTGSARWQLVGGSSGTVTILGDVIVEAGQFTAHGTGSVTHVVVDHYGDVVVTGGNFSVARGGQGGEGTTRWNLHEGDFSMSNATTQNSNRPGATFVFLKDGEQNLSLDDVSYAGGGFPITVADGAVLMVTADPIGGNGEFTVEDGGALATAHPDGIDGAVQTEGIITFEPQAGLWFVGTEPQVFGTFMPESVGVLLIGNPAGVTASDATNAATLVVEAGALLSIAETGALSVDGGTVDGLVVNEGELTAETALDFGAEATYEHARDGGSVPSGNWAEGSTALFTGIVGEAPENRGQDYHHLVLNTPDLLSNRDLSLDGNTIGGNIHVVSTGSARWQLVGGDSGTVTIMGDLIMEDGQFASQGTGSLTHVVIDHYGDIVVTGGNFSISRGSQGGGKGTTRWYLHEGDFSMSEATTQNSNRPGATFVFARDGEQSLALDEVSYAGGGLPLLVADESILRVAADPIGGNGEFTVEAGGTLASVHADGVSGSVQTEGIVTFDEVSSFIFDGSVAQITSELMPTVVQDLVINNEAGVALSQETVINGVLRLQAGTFDNTIPFTLGPDGTISYEGGNLLHPISSEETGVPSEFRFYQNYPNPFTAHTTIRFDVRESVHVSITVYDLIGRRVAMVIDEMHAPGSYSVEWEAAGLSSGVYLFQLNAGDFSSVRRVTLMR